MSLILDGTNGVSDIDGTAATPAICGTDTNTGIFFPAVDTAAVATGGTEVARFDSAGNLGVGTSSPTGRLTVQDATSGNGTIRYGSNPTYYGEIKLIYASDEFRIGAYGSSEIMTYYTAGSERMRISSAGLVSVGTAFAGSRLQSKGIGGVAAAAGLSPGNNGDGTLEWYNATSGYVGAVTVNASTVVYGGTSDYRLKENIAPMTGALARVSLLKPVTYTWKVDGESGEGFIAHELQEICPSAVVGEKDALNKDGSIKPQQVDTSFLVATLTAAIQELKTELDSVKAELATLKA